MFQFQILQFLFYKFLTFLNKCADKILIILSIEMAEPKLVFKIRNFSFKKIKPFLN